MTQMRRTLLNSFGSLPHLSCLGRLVQLLLSQQATHKEKCLGLGHQPFTTQLEFHNSVCENLYRIY